MLKIGTEYNKKYAEISIAGRMWIVDADADENLSGLAGIAKTVADEEQKYFEETYKKALETFDTDLLASDEFKANIKKSCKKMQGLLDGILLKATKCYDENSPDEKADNSNPSGFIFSHISASWTNHCKLLGLVSSEIANVIKGNTINAEVFEPVQNDV